MFNRLFGTASPVRKDASRAPEGSRVYAIGDIHGRLDLLRTLHGLILKDAEANPSARRVVVYLGDYVDRGSDSAGVIDLLLDAPLQGFESVHIKGNHEDALLKFFEDSGMAPEWMNYGGRETLWSYGVAPPMLTSDPGEITRAQEAFVAKLPDRHRYFYEGLRLHHVEGDYLFVHAGIRPEVPLDRQEEHDLLWIRERFLQSNANHGKVVVHGHTITDRPETRPNRIGIDTGAFATGRLTCLVLDGTDRTFLQT